MILKKLMLELITDAATMNGAGVVHLARRTDPAKGNADQLDIAAGETITIAVGGYIVCQTDPGQVSLVTMSATYLGP